MTTRSAQYLGTLHKQINTYFNFSEVKTLCFNLGVDHENIPGDGRSAFIRNLVVSMAKRNRLQELVDHVREERSFVEWQNVPADFELPDSIIEEDIRQVVHYHEYHGDVDNSTTTYNQQGQHVAGNQFNTAGDMKVGQVGDVVHGDKVGGDKVGGDKISVGNISNSEGVAIGGGASANVERKTVQPTPVQQPSAKAADVPTSTDVNVQKEIDRLKRYLQMASDEYKNMADELAASINIVLMVAAEEPVNAVHLKLLSLGQVALARKLADDVPGIEQVVERFVTAVNQTGL